MDWQTLPKSCSTAITPDSAEQTVQHLYDTVAAAWHAHQLGDPEVTRHLLAAALPQLMQALNSLGIDPVQALRQQPPSALSQSSGQRLLYIEGNRVEVQVNGEVRGSWSIWSIADLKEVCRLAEEFDCALVYSIDPSLDQGAA